VLRIKIIKSLVPEYAPGTIYKIDGSSPVTLGRGSKADIRIEFRKFSRKHLQFVPTSQGWCVKDLGSTNGSQLNCHDIEAIEPLHAGDRIGAGKFLFNVTYVSAPSQGPKQVHIYSKADKREDELATQHVSRSPEDELIAKMEGIFD